MRLCEPEAVKVQQQKCRGIAQIPKGPDVLLEGREGRRQPKGKEKKKHWGLGDWEGSTRKGTRGPPR